MSVGCKIIRDFQRPDPELVKLFRGLPVANIDDNMERTAAVESSIVAYGKGQLLGTAFTVQVAQGDNLMFHAAMDLAKPGDVIVIDAGGFTERAIFGELMATYCKVRGIRGIVCDGAIRDAEGLAAMEDFPVYAKAVTPNGPYKNGPGQINVPVVIGGKVVHPGDIVVGDSDGVLFIRPENARQLAEATLAVGRKEAEIMRHILEDGTYIRPWVDELLEKIHCEIL
jgi:regulator of RNase E activity RraA